MTAIREREIADVISSAFGHERVHRPARSGFRGMDFSLLDRGDRMRQGAGKRGSDDSSCQEREGSLYQDWRLRGLVEAIALIRWLFLGSVGKNLFFLIRI
jgi:hypothetical protein